MRTIKKTFSAVTAPMCVVSLGAVCCPQLSEDCEFHIDNTGKTAIIKEEKEAKGDKGSNATRHNEGRH